MSDASNLTVECMADRFMRDYERAAAAGYAQSKAPEFVLLSALLKELRGLRADLKAHHEIITAVGLPVAEL